MSEGKKDRISRKYMTKETKADLYTGRTWEPQLESDMAWILNSILYPADSAMSNLTKEKESH